MVGWLKFQLSYWWKKIFQKKQFNLFSHSTNLEFSLKKRQKLNDFELND